MRVIIINVDHQRLFRILGCIHHLNNAFHPALAHPCKIVTKIFKKPGHKPQWNGKTERDVPWTIARLGIAPVNIDVDPALARPACRATLKQSEEAVVVEDYTAWPLQQPVEAGLYALNVAADAPYKSRNELLFVRPPAMTRRVKVGP